MDSASACLGCSLYLVFCGGNLSFHFNNHFCQHHFALCLAVGIDVSGVLLAIRPDGRIPPLPQVVVDLRDASGAWFASLPFVSPEGAGSGLLRCRYGLLLGLSPTDSLVDLHRRCTAHFVGDMGVYIQRGAAGDVTDDGRERFDVHAVFQTRCAKYMA